MAAVVNDSPGDCQSRRLTEGCGQIEVSVLERYRCPLEFRAESAKLLKILILRKLTRATENKSRPYRRYGKKRLKLHFELLQI